MREEMGGQSGKRRGKEGKSGESQRREEFEAEQALRWAESDGLETRTYRDVRAPPRAPDADKRPSDVGTEGCWAMGAEPKESAPRADVGAATRGGRSRSAGVAFDAHKRRFAGRL